jgi:hypothetical protein
MAPNKRQYKRQYRRYLYLHDDKVVRDDKNGHPNTNKFREDIETQADRLRQAGYNAMPGDLDTLRCDFNKRFRVDNLVFLYSVVICIGFAKDLLYACPDGNVIRETIRPFHETFILYTRKTKAEISLASFNRYPMLQYLPALKPCWTA